jgi:DNA repair exonuclease SbcCD ATPase subunit
MANDLFSGLVKNFAAFMPKDDPQTKVFQVQTEISDLENREQELYVQIGKKVYASICKKPEYSEIVQELTTIQRRLENARAELQRVQNEKEEKDRQEKEELLSRTCSNCDTVNPEGLKFCQECGTKLGQTEKYQCPNCSTDYLPGTRFCGECGIKLS